ncbi:MAG: gamma-glutamylcyclotransferase [Actinomycetota bacterium]
MRVEETGTDAHGAEHRLAVYGTLAPGRPNHHVLADLGGRWIEGTVRGALREEGWGAALGYPGIVLDPDGLEVTVHMLDAVGLTSRWADLDAFEGPGYRRSTTIVRTATGDVVASIYELALPGETPSG